MPRIQFSGEDDEALDDQPEVVANGGELAVELFAQAFDRLLRLDVSGHPVIVAPPMQRVRSGAIVCTKTAGHRASIAAIFSTVFQFRPVTRLFSVFSTSAVVKRERPVPSG